MKSLLDVSGFGLRDAERALDPEFVGPWLARTLFAETPGDLVARPVYLRLKPATSLFVTYEVACEHAPTGARELVHLSLGSGDLVARERAKWETLHPSLGPRSCFLAFDEELDAVLARFPFDLGLTRLPHALLPQRIKRLCEELDDPFGDGERVAVRERGSLAQLLSWRPRRRAVVRWSLRARAGERFVERRAIARLHQAAPPAGTAWRHGPTPSFLPRVLATHDGGRLVIEEVLAGAVAKARDLGSVGNLVGRFHRFTADRMGAMTTPAVLPATELARASAATRDAEALAPRLAAVARAALRALRSIEDSDLWRDHVGLHGDLHAGQILEDGAALALCDLDRVEPGPRAVDLGRLAADLLVRESVGLERLTALLDGYAEATGEAVHLEALRPFIALGLVRAASEPLRRFEVDAEARAERRLELARDLTAKRPRAAAAGASLVFDRFLRLPHGECGARYEVRSPRKRRHAMGSYLYFRVEPAQRPGGETSFRARRRRSELLPFPSDAALPGVERLVRAGAEPIAWRPGKRAVLREERSGEILYWKVLAARHYAAQRTLLTRPEAAHLFEAGFVRVVEASEDLCAIAFAAAHGTSLHDRLARGEDVDPAALARGVRRIAAAGSSLAASGALRPFGIEEEFEALRRATTFASEVRPELATAFESVLERLLPPVHSGPIGFLHRDLHDKQLFSLDGRSVDESEWIDADTFAVGPRALDETNLAAHLWLRGRQGVAARGGEFARVLLAAFEFDPTQSGSEPRFFLATSLLRLAAVYSVRRTAKGIVPDLLAAAEHVLAEGVLP